MFLGFSGPYSRGRFLFLFCFLHITVKEKPYPELWDDSVSASQGLIGCSIVVISQPRRERLEERNKKLPFKDVTHKLHSSLLF